MDYKEAAKRLGVSVGTVYNWLKTGKLKGIKKDSGEWDISIESIESILGQYYHEADIVRLTILIDNKVKEKRENHLKQINNLCLNFNKMYDAGNPDSIKVAEAIAAHVTEIHSLEKTQEHIKEATQDEFTPFEPLKDEGIEANE